jgi:hypothetical protein
MSNFLAVGNRAQASTRTVVMAKKKRDPAGPPQWAAPMVYVFAYDCDRPL